MDIKSLQVFNHLSQSLHFGQTAHAFHLSPSTLSRMIKRLEDELGCQLLQRDNRSVAITEQGQRLTEYAKQQIEQWQQLQGDLQNGDTQLKGRLRIYCSVTAAYSHLPQVLDGFRRQYPQIEIKLTTGNANDAIEMVKHQQADIAIAAKPENLASSYGFYSLAQIPLSIIAPSIECQVTEQLNQRVIDWQNIPVILPDHGQARERFQRWYRQKVVSKPNIYATVTGHEALVSMVALGCGIGIAPEVVIANSPVQDRITRLTPPNSIMPFELGLCYSKKRSIEPVIKAFLQTVK